MKVITPGSLLKENFLDPIGITQKQLADHLGVDFKVINRIVNNKSAITPKMAVKLAAAFKTEASYWLQAQNEVDLQKATLELGNDLPAALIPTASSS